MLSPSHPGPYKATHLAMRDRTVNETNLVASAPLLVSNSVGVNRGSTSTDYCAKDCALLAANRCAYCRAGAGSDTSRELVAMAIPK